MVKKKMIIGWNQTSVLIGSIMIHLVLFLRHRWKLHLFPNQNTTAVSVAVTVVVLLGVTHDHNGTHAMVHAVIADTAEPSFGGSLGGAEAAASHDDGAEPEALHFQTQPLLHVVVLHNVDLERYLRLHQRLR